jgi:hypothetical protein
MRKIMGVKASHNPAITQEAIGVLKAMARGEGGWLEAARRLALAVLEGSPVVRLAVEVLQGGEHVEARVADLCEAVLLQENATGGREGREAG